MSRDVAVCLLVLLGGCSSVPLPDFYTLDMRSSGSIETALVLEDVRIHSSEAVSRPEIMIRTSPTKIEYYATNRWAADIGEQLREKLKAEFGPGESTGSRVDIEGELLAFEQVDTATGAEGRVKLELQAFIRSASGNETQFNKMYEVIIPAEAAMAGSVVEALSRGVEQIAEELAHDLVRASGGV